MAGKSAKPKTGRKADSKMVSFLKELSKSGVSENLPTMPEPVFDEHMGKEFAKRKIKQRQRSV